MSSPSDRAGESDASDASGDGRDQTAGPLEQAEATAARISSGDQPFGEPGRPLNRRSPFFVGMLGAAGVAVTYGIGMLVLATRDLLVLIGLAFFLAVGMEPAISWLVRRGLRRWVAMTTVFVVALGLLVGFLIAAIPLLVQQAGQFVEQVPDYLREAEQEDSVVGRLIGRFDVQQRVEEFLSSRGAEIFSGLLTAGQVVFGVATSTVIVVVLTVYFAADLPRIRAALYRLFPQSRRPRAILIGDEIFAKVGGYVLGNLLISAIAGSITLVWLLVVGVPYALLLALLVAVLDLIPVVGATTAGIVVSLVALTVSPIVCAATIAFFILYQFAEDYLLTPKIIGKRLSVPGVVTVVAVLLGGALLGVVGALVAIPAAAALLLLAEAMLLPRLDRS